MHLVTMGVCSRSRDLPTQARADAACSGCTPRAPCPRVRKPSGSRSVTTPRARARARSSTTGTQPISCPHMSVAGTTRLSAGLQAVTGRDMISSTCVILSSLDRQAIGGGFVASATPAPSRARSPRASRFIGSWAASPRPTTRAPLRQRSRAERSSKSCTFGGVVQSSWPSSNTP